MYITLKRMCQIDMLLLREMIIFTSQLLLFKPFGWDIHHLPLSIISRLLYHRMAGSLYAISQGDFLARCFPVRFCQ